MPSTPQETRCPADKVLSAPVKTLAFRHRRDCPRADLNPHQLKSNGIFIGYNEGNRSCRKLLRRSSLGAKGEVAVMHIYIPEFLRGALGELAANPPAGNWGAFCALSCTALAVTANALNLDSHAGKTGEAARDAAGLNSGGSVPPDNYRQHEDSPLTTAMAMALPARHLRDRSRRLWTRDDGFTMSGPRRT